MNNLSPRQEKLLEIVNKKGHLQVTEIQQIMRISQATAYRTRRRLGERAALSDRAHGRARARHQGGGGRAADHADHLGSHVRASRPDREGHRGGANIALSNLRNFGPRFFVPRRSNVRDEAVPRDGRLVPQSNTSASRMRASETPCRRCDGPWRSIRRRAVRGRGDQRDECDRGGS